MDRRTPREPNVEPAADGDTAPGPVLIAERGAAALYRASHGGETPVEIARHAEPRRRRDTDDLDHHAGPDITARARLIPAPGRARRRSVYF
ncbi:MAG TPA: hypothetical protein VGT02_00625, partial [Methylomirabilota bacterium]|nr:hypothetical protein [Methylomirabilota bacterium]